MVLGGHPTVSRLVEYKLFMGLPADTISFYAVPKILGTEYFDKVKSEFKKIKIIYKLPDYPNLRVLSGIKEDIKDLKRDNEEIKKIVIAFSFAKKNELEEYLAKNLGISAEHVKFSASIKEAAGKIVV